MRQYLLNAGKWGKQPRPPALHHRTPAALDAHSTAILRESDARRSVPRHWDPRSEPYAGADALLSALEMGWAVQEPVYREIHWFNGVRQIHVYHFTLVQRSKALRLPVIGNPRLERFLASCQLQVCADPETSVNPPLKQAALAWAHNQQE